MRIEIVFATYSYLTSAASGLHIGLYNIDTAVFVSQSLLCYTNDTINQYRTLRSTFYMPVESNTHRYVPFFSNAGSSTI